MRQGISDWESLSKRGALPWTATRSNAKFASLFGIWALFSGASIITWSFPVQRKWYIPILRNWDYL